MAFLNVRTTTFPILGQKSSDVLFIEFTFDIGDNFLLMNPATLKVEITSSVLGFLSDRMFGCRSESL